MFDSPQRHRAQKSREIPDTEAPYGFPVSPETLWWFFRLGDSSFGFGRQLDLAIRHVHAVLDLLAAVLLANLLGLLLDE